MDQNKLGKVPAQIEHQLRSHSGSHIQKEAQKHQRGKQVFGFCLKKIFLKKSISARN
jgi:hypothetical protein